MTAALQTDLLFLLNDVARLMRVRADQRARVTGMTRAQWVILIWLERRPAISQNELAALVEVEPITIARLVDRLEARGLVERRLDARDRRVRRLHLTEAAQPYMAQIHDYKLELEAMSNAGLSTETLNCVRDALLVMKANLLEERRESAQAV